MKVLLWDTSGVPWGVGVAEIDAGESTLLAGFEDDGPRTLARGLIGSVDQVLAEANCSLSDIDACAVSLGPGSWTGLRIGLTAAKTMAQSLNLPIVGIATFDIFAQALHDRTLQTPHLLLIQSPCRPGELYAKLWHCHGVPAHDTEYDLLEAEWIGAYSQVNSRLEFWMNERNVSKAVSNLPETKIETSLREAISVPIEWRKSTFSQRLQALGQLAALKIRDEQYGDVLQIQPIYLAPSAAEREYNAKHHGK